MKMISKLLIVPAVLFVCSISAMADIKWTLVSGYPGALTDGITFSNGNTATGWFDTDATGTSITSYDVVVTGPASAAAFVANSAGLSPVEVNFADFSRNPNAYVALYPGQPLPASGGALVLLNGHDNYGDFFGVDCDGCGVINPATGAALLAENYTPGDPILSAPEPTSAWSLIAMLSAVVALVATRRTRSA